MDGLWWKILAIHGWLGGTPMKTPISLRIPCHPRFEDVVKPGGCTCTGILKHGPRACKVRLPTWRFPYMEDPKMDGFDWKIPAKNGWFRGYPYFRKAPTRVYGELWWMGHNGACKATSNRRASLCRQITHSGMISLDLNITDIKSPKDRHLNFKDTRSRLIEMIATTIFTCVGYGHTRFRMFQSPPKKMRPSKNTWFYVCNLTWRFPKSWGLPQSSSIFSWHFSLK